MLMNLNKNYIKNQISLKRRAQLDISHAEQSYYINVFLTKTCEIFEYVDVKKDEKIYKIDRQEINPFYIDFNFFSSVKRIKVNTKDDLTPAVINYLNENYSATTKNYQDVHTWFDEIGYNILVNDITINIDDVTGKKIEENGLEKLDKLQPNLESIVSKSFYFPIDINK